MFIDDFDYMDYFDEPSEVNKVIEEMKDRLQDLIKDEAKKMMDGYRQMDEEFVELKNEVTRKKRELKRLEKEIEDMETKYEQADIRDIPKKYVDRIVRYYTGNFAPGDKVFIIDKTTKRIQCDKCNGEKNIKAIIDDEVNTIQCIKCKGYGSVGETVKTIKETTIDNVHLKLVFKKDRVSLWTSDSVYVRGREYAVDPKDIFKTYEDAEKSMKEIK